MWEILLSLQILVQVHSLIRVEKRLFLRVLVQDTHIILLAEQNTILKRLGLKDLKTANKE